MSIRLLSAHQRTLIVARISASTEAVYSVWRPAIWVGNYTISGTGKGTLASNPASVSWVSGYKYLLEWSAGEMIAGAGNITITIGSAVKDVAGISVGSPNFGNANGSRVIHAIDCGPVRSVATYPIYPFESERNYWSGSPMVGFYLSDTVNGFQQDDGTPTAVYTSEKDQVANLSPPPDLVYTLPNITGGINHTVRLYFFNNGYYWVNPGEVLFDVVINGVTKLSAFDLIGAVTGMPYVGLWREFPNITAQNGAITVKIVAEPAYNSAQGVYYYNSTISGIKVTAQ